MQAARGQIKTATKRHKNNFSDLVPFVPFGGLFRYDCFDLIALQESDHSIAAIPNAVSGTPDLVSLNLAAAG